ncbi:MAG: hypothetical protein ACKVOM_02070, partial [Ferruginibacter sp.]
MKKKITSTYFFTVFKIVLFCFIGNNLCFAQEGFTNFGNLAIHPQGNVGTIVPFVNSNAEVGDYLNNGDFFTTSNFTNNKLAMPAGSGNTTFNGTAATPQLIAGGDTSRFYNLIINNNNPMGGVRIDRTIGIQNEFNLSAASKLSLNTGDIILRSTAARTAYITNLGTTGPSPNISYGSGLFNIERYLQAVKSWRLLATPIQNDGLSIRNSWQEGGSTTSTGYGTQITGPIVSGTGMDQYTQRGSMMWFDTTTNKYVVIGNTTDPIARPQGYYVFVRGDRAQNVGGPGGVTTLRMRGRILTGDQTFIAPRRTGPTNGFQSVGNPYPSQISYQTVEKMNLEPTFTIWNPSGGVYGVGRFIQYISTTGLNGVYSNGVTPMNTIESGQAFFIQSTSGGSGRIIIKETDKLSGSNLVSRNAGENRLGVTDPTLQVNLHDAGGNTTPTFLDYVVLNFDSSYSNDFDGNDVRKFMNANDNLAIKNGSFNLILERRRTLQANDTIFLSLTSTRVAPYRFEIDPSVLGNLALEAFLKDNFLQTETPVSLTDVTNVNFNITSDAASRA